MTLTQPKFKVVDYHPITGETKHYPTPIVKETAKWWYVKVTQGITFGGIFRIRKTDTPDATGHIWGIRKGTNGLARFDEELFRIDPE